MHRRAEWPSGREVPQPGGGIHAPGDDRAAVGAERHRGHKSRMLQDRAQRLAGGGVPQPRRLVRARGGQFPAVGAKRDRLDRVLMEDGPADGPAGRDVPQPRRGAPVPGGDRLAVRAEGHAGHLGRVGEDFLTSTWLLRQAARLSSATCRAGASPPRSPSSAIRAVQAMPRPISSFSKAARPREVEPCQPALRLRQRGLEARPRSPFSSNALLLQVVPPAG